MGDKFAVEDLEIKETPEERSERTGSAGASTGEVDAEIGVLSERTRRVTKSAHAPTWAFSSNV
jgi:hypothetical protein